LFFSLFHKLTTKISLLELPKCLDYNILGYDSAVWYEVIIIISEEHTATYFYTEDVRHMFLSNVLTNLPHSTVLELRKAGILSYDG
jgi:hypothetical protein